MQNEIDKIINKQLKKDKTKELSENEKRDLTILALNEIEEYVKFIRKLMK